METTFPVFSEIVEYEVSASERYRRYASLVLIHSPIDHEGLKEEIRMYVRKSDVMAMFDHSIAVLMSETDMNLALCAVDRFHGILGKRFDTRFSVASYPSDDGGAETLMETSLRRLQRAKEDTPEHVVCRH